MLRDADRTRTSNELGEDTCELFELIEDSFGVQFGDYNFLLGKSVEEIAQLVAERSSFPPSEQCLSQTVLYVFREVFVSSFGLSRGSIRPGTRLARNYSRLAARYAGTNGKAISVFLTQLITAWMGAKPSGVTSKTRIPEGLNIY